jgi:hypothetical protein
MGCRWSWRRWEPVVQSLLFCKEEDKVVDLWLVKGAKT